MSEHRILMPTFEDYYKDLLRWENEPHRELVHRWPGSLRDQIESALTNAVSESGLKAVICPLEPSSTNQSIGNQVEKFTIEKLDTAVSGFSISPCPGSGYPDKVLVQEIMGVRIPLEVKSTSDWKDTDGNRRVLTSSSKKLRSQFTAPIYHLLLTAVYLRGQNDTAKIEAIRIDFLEPTTFVNIRLEASVSQKILAHGSHYSATI